MTCARRLALARRLGPGALALTLLAGCPLPLHQPPPRNAPAATVKLRLGHQWVPRGTQAHFFNGRWPSLISRRLWSQLAIDDHEHPYAPQQGVAATWTRVKPGWRRYEIRSQYNEIYSVEVRESYYETEYKSCNKNVCDYSSGSYKCSYKYVSCNQQVQKWRYVRRLRYRTVGRCSTRLAVYMRRDVTYLLSYRYVGPGACSLSCHVQRFNADGTFRLSPCPNVQ